MPRVGLEPMESKILRQLKLRNGWEFLHRLFVNILLELVLSASHFYNMEGLSDYGIVSCQLIGRSRLLRSPYPNSDSCPLLLSLVNVAKALHIFCSARLYFLPS